MAAHLKLGNTISLYIESIMRYPGQSSADFLSNTVCELSDCVKSIEKNLCCPICLETITEAYINPECGHRFCGDCIKRWLQDWKKHECPQCRTYISSRRTLRRDAQFDDLKDVYCRINEVVNKGRDYFAVATSPPVATPSTLSAQSAGGDSIYHYHILPWKSIQSPMQVNPPRISEAEYTNLQTIMTHFRKVPFISELNRPFLTYESQGQPQHINIPKRDFSMVYHSIQQREYRYISEVCIDMRRIFKSCVSYHSHTSVEREGGFSCITSMAKAIHLRKYFDWLWVEYMIPSDVDRNEASEEMSPIQMAHQSAHGTRSKDRKERNHLLDHIVLNNKFLWHAADKITKFAGLRGCVDGLDKDPIENDNEQYKVIFDFIFQNLQKMALRLSRTESVTEGGYTTYTVKDLYTDLQQCYSELAMLGSQYSSFRLKFENRLDRLLSQILIPLHEVMCRGMSQSKVWGTAESIVLARKDSTSPYWPSLVLGFLSVADSREEWHDIYTKMNQARLTEEMYSELLAEEMKTEYSMKEAGCTSKFFLVEMLGTHKFMWVKQANVALHEFDPQEDLAYMSGMNLTNDVRVDRDRAHEEGISALNDYDGMHVDPCGKCIRDNEEDHHHSNELDERRSTSRRFRKRSQLNFGHINEITPEATNELVGGTITINEKKILPKKRKIEF